MTLAFTPSERRIVVVMGSLFALRLFGLFLILPVFSPYALDHYQGSTPRLVGAAIGAYGLMQALMQIPLGIWSDRIGRKPILLLALLFLGLGSLIAAFSHHILGVIAGRVLQGAGALSAAAVAAIADSTREEVRSKAMALIGLSIGLTFCVAIVLGQLLGPIIQVPGLFLLTALLACSGGFLIRFIPETGVRHHYDGVGLQMWALLKDPTLRRLNIGIFIQHLLFTASFVGLPLLLRHDFHFNQHQSALLYLGSLLFSFLLIFPLLKRRGDSLLLLGALGLFLGLLSISFANHSVLGLSISLLLYFAGFNLLEAILPSLVSQVAPKAQKGAALGIYWSSQYLGLFAGGILGGALLHQMDLRSLFLMLSIPALVWFLFLVGDDNRPPKT